MIHVTHDGWAAEVPDGQLLAVAKLTDRIWHIRGHDRRHVATSRRNELLGRMIGIARDNAADMIFLISSTGFRPIVYRAISALTAFGVAGESPNRIRRLLAMWSDADKLSADEVELVISRVVVPDNETVSRQGVDEGLRAAGDREHSDSATQGATATGHSPAGMHHDSEVTDPAADLTIGTANYGGVFS
jgi:hypothetical protein